jgi:uncharacterized cupin superfamily protein
MSDLARQPPSLVAFRGDAPAPGFDRPRSERLVRGNPLRTTWSWHATADGVLDCGIWHCEPGAWRIAFAEDTDEFFCVIEGRIRITPQTGDAQTFGPGEACVIPAGFRGTFEVLEAVRKHYVIVVRPSTASATTT